MTTCSPSDPERLAALQELSDDALMIYAGVHVSLDSCDLITALAERVQVLKQDNETGYW